MERPWTWPTLLPISATWAYGRDRLTSRHARERRVATAKTSKTAGEVLTRDGRPYLVSPSIGHLLSGPSFPIRLAAVATAWEKGRKTFGAGRWLPLVSESGRVLTGSPASCAGPVASRPSLSIPEPMRRFLRQA